MKNVAELKKIKVGDYITLIKTNIEKMQKYIGIKRLVSKIQTNGFYIKTQTDKGFINSWIDFPKAIDFISTADGFGYYTKDKLAYLEYKIEG